MKRSAHTAFSDAVKKIADLHGKYDMRNPKDRLAATSEVSKLNLDLVNCIMAYTSGKEASRISDDGKERFNNALDALAVMSRNTPSMKKQADDFVGKINRIRKAENGNKLFVNLDDFGEKRAAQAKLSGADKNTKDVKKLPQK